MMMDQRDLRCAETLARTVWIKIGISCLDYKAIVALYSKPWMDAKYVNG